MLNYEINSYLVSIKPDRHVDDGEVEIRRIVGRPDKSGLPVRRWKIKINRYVEGPVLNRDFEWEYEPLPSSRDDDFISRCRYESFEEALQVLEQYVERSK